MSRTNLLFALFLVTTACTAVDDSSWDEEAIQESASALSLTFEPFATHPSIAAQPEFGRRISDIAVQGNRLILGYGDYNANTGPIDVAALDATTGAASVLLSQTPTEAILTYRTLDGVIYGPETDPRTDHSQPAGYASSEGGWHSVRQTPAVHLYDISKVGTKLVLVGSESLGGAGAAVAYVSSDNGATWQKGQSETADDPADNYERYYWAVNLNGKVYMQGRGSNKVFPVKIFDGTSWKTGTTNNICFSFEGHTVEAFNGLLYCATSISDGSRSTGGFNMRDWFKHGAHLYGVDSTGKVVRTNGVPGKGRTRGLTVTWETIGQGPADALSIAIVNGRVFLGRADGSVVVSTTSI